MQTRQSDISNSEFPPASPQVDRAPSRVRPVFTDEAVGFGANAPTARNADTSTAAALVRPVGLAIDAGKSVPRADGAQTAPINAPV